MQGIVIPASCQDFVDKWSWKTTRIFNSSNGLIYFNRAVSKLLNQQFTLYYYNGVVIHRNEVLFQELLDCFTNDLENKHEIRRIWKITGNSEYNTAKNYEHNYTSALPPFRHPCLQDMIQQLATRLFIVQHAVRVSQHKALYPDTTLYII